MSPGWADLDRGLFSISVAAELAGLHPQTLRIYEREGLLDPARSAGGTRRYSRRDIEKLAEICALAADGLNLAGIRRVLALQEETRQLQAELTQLRELAGQPPVPRRPRPPRPRPGAGQQPGPGRDQLPGGSCPPSRACRRAVRAWNPGPQDSHLFSSWGQFAVFAVCTALLLVVGGVLFRRRDA